MQCVLGSRGPTRSGPGKDTGRKVAQGQRDLLQHLAECRYRPVSRQTILQRLSSRMDVARLQSTQVSGSVVDSWASNVEPGSLKLQL